MNPRDKHHAQRLRIRALEDQLQLPPQPDPPAEALDSVEQTLRYLSTIDEEPRSTLAKQLIAQAIELPPPDSLVPDQLSAKIDEIIVALATLHTYLEHTNHLDDRGLYQHLWEHVLNEPTHELDDTMGQCACHIDLVGDGSERSNLLFLEYYADQFDRDLWEQEWPEHVIPPHREPPSDRDARLPKPDYE